MTHLTTSSVRVSLTTLDDSNSTTETELENNNKIHGYHLLEIIGQGAFGQVRLATKDKKKDFYAVKVFNKTELNRKRGFIRDFKGRNKPKSALEKIEQEISILRQLDHPNVIKVFEVFDDPMTNLKYMVMEHAVGGPILEWDDGNEKFFPPKYKGYLCEDTLRVLFNQIIDGVEYLHSQGIIHGDIKPQNILHDDLGRPKLADFGSAVRLEDPKNDKLTSAEGTSYFLAPETQSENLATEGYSAKGADIWAMGVTFYTITFHCLPFYHENMLGLYDKIMNEPIQFPKGRKVSDELKKIISCMLEKDPRRRMTIKQLKNDKWLRPDEPIFKKKEIREKTIKEVKEEEEEEAEEENEEDEDEEDKENEDRANKENIMRMYEKCRKSITFSQEIDTSDWFIEEETTTVCGKDKGKIRRSDSSRYEWAEPRKKVHNYE